MQCWTSRLAIQQRCRLALCERKGVQTFATASSHFESRIPAGKDGVRTLEGFRVVLVSPKSPGNLGSVCRLCDCFEASEIVVVDPRCDLNDESIRILAVDKPHNNAANETLRSRLRVSPNLKEALADTTASIAFTRRTGSNRKSAYVSMSSLLEDDHTLLSSKDGSTALVFGRVSVSVSAHFLLSHF